MKKSHLIILLLGMALSVQANALGAVKEIIVGGTDSNVSETSNTLSMNNNYEIDLMVRHSVPCPWVLEEMDDQTFDNKVKAYINDLGSITNSKLVGEFKEALLLRAHEDSVEYARLKDHWGKMEGEQTRAWRALEKELDRYESFLYALGNNTVRFAFEGNVTLNGTTANCEFKSVRLMTTNSSVLVKCDANDDKFYFYDGVDKTFLEGEDLETAMKDVRRFFYIYYLLIGQKDTDLIKTGQTASFCWQYSLMANDNNKPENITRYDYPKAGALNSISSAALASAKQNETYRNAISVVIDADSWTFDKDGLGNIIRRRVGGWAIEQTKYGKLARRAQFAQDYSNGSYGPTKLYGIGGGHMYLK